jgi:hypothetical protein
MEAIIILLIVFIIWILPIIIGVKMAKKKHLSPHLMWIGILPMWGLVIMIIICLLPELKLCSKCDEKNKKYAKYCQRCNNEFEESSITAPPNKLTKKQVVFRACMIGGAIIVFCFSFFILLQNIFKTSDIYKMAFEEMAINMELKEIIGDQIKQKGFISGSISTSGSSGNANMSFRVTSSNGLFRINVIGEKEFDTWKITNFNFRSVEK